MPAISIQFWSAAACAKTGAESTDESAIADATSKELIGFMMNSLREILESEVKSDRWAANKMLDQVDFLTTVTWPFMPAS